MPTLPLIASRSPDDLIAHRGTQGIRATAFLKDAASLAARLPPAGRLLNLCEDRYHFAVALAAGLLTDRCTLLPPTHAPEALRRVHALAAPLVCLTDQDATPAVLAELRCPIITVGSSGASRDLSAPATHESSAQSAPQFDVVPRINVAQTAVIIFTSGSTGAPVPHAKSFGQLVAAAQVQMTRLPGATRARGFAVLGTVPSQHMFGLEATILLPLQGLGALCAERPFFPADIVAALRRLPRPRALVSTPLHLRALLDSGLAIPPLDLVLCATATLPEALARDIEACSGAPLIEIYGSTETGQIASRRAAQGRAWQLWPEVHLHRAEGHWYAQGGHVPVATALADELELLGEGRFLLHGRTADLVNVAGKRSSLAHLSQQLLSVPGVQDGAFYLQETAADASGGVTRLGALVVAPSLAPAQIIAALRERVDPVFLPRPLWLVERLPRNSTGKLPREALDALVAQLTEQRAGPAR